MNNNTAFVCHIGNFEPIEGADRIIKASVILENAPITTVVVGKTDYQENDLVVYFDSNLCLTDEAISMFDHANPNHTKEDFTSISRYLARGNRIRTIKLRGVYSDGLVVNTKYFTSFFKNEKTAIDTLKEGFSFTLIGDVEVCKKYLPPVKQQSIPGAKKDRKKKKLISRVIPEMFRFHIDTQQAARNVHVFKPDQLISVSSKWHGCVSAKTKVDTLEFGVREIKEIVDNELSCHIKAMNTQNNEIVYAKVDAFYKKENDGDWFEIELENGTKLEITGNNPVWLPELRCYRRVDSLQGNEKLLFDY